MSNRGDDFRFEREGEGRYLVISLPDDRRIGLVIGGNGRWNAEDIHGHFLGQGGTRRIAARIIVNHLQSAVGAADGHPFSEPAAPVPAA